MKILLLSPIVWNFFWQRFQEIATGLAKNGHQIIFVEPIRYKNPKTLRLKEIVNNKTPDNIKIIKRETSLRRGLLFAMYEDIINALLLIKYKPDAIVSYQTLNSASLSIFSKFSKSKFILDYVDEMSELMGNKYEALAVKKIFTPLTAKFSDSIITSAIALKKDMSKYNGNITIIPNGVDINKFNHTSATKNKGFTIGFVGSFGHWIDFNIIIESAKLLPQVDFHLYGDGSEYKRILKKSKDIPNLHIHGRIDYTKVPMVISKFDIGIIPFKINRLSNRVCPLKIFEYWALKKPVLCTQTTELKHIATNKAFFIKNSTDLKNTISYLLQNKDELLKYGKIGYKEVIQKYNYSTLSKNYSDFIIKTVNK